MGAGTSRKGSTAKQDGVGAFVQQQQEQNAKQAAQKQYEVDKRSQYENLPQSLRNKITFEDAYADRGPAAAKQAAQKQEPGIDGTSSEYFDPGKFERLKAEVDQQRSRNTSGIAFGPGRSNRGDINLGRQLQNRRQRR